VFVCALCLLATVSGGGDGDMFLIWLDVVWYLYLCSMGIACTWVAIENRAASLVALIAQRIDICSVKYAIIYTELCPHFCPYSTFRTQSRNLGD